MIIERRCINLYSDMNPWMDLVVLVNDEDFDKAKEVIEKSKSRRRVLGLWRLGWMEIKRSRY